MKYFIRYVSLLLMIAGLCTTSIAQPYNWAFSAQGTGTDYGLAICTDNGGDKYAVGVFDGSISFNTGSTPITLTSAGDQDIYIVKYDHCTNLAIWAYSIGGIYRDNTDWDAMGITYDNGQIFITGSINRDAAVTANAASGTSQTLAAMSGNGNDIFVASYDLNGNLNWTRAVGSVGSDPESGHDIETDLFHNVYVTGQFWQTVNFGLGGTSHSRTSAGASDIFVWQLTNTGTTSSVQQAGGGSLDVGLNIVKGDYAIYMYVSGLCSFNGYLADFPYNDYAGHIYPRHTAKPNSGAWAAFVAKINPSAACDWLWVNDLTTNGRDGINASIDYDQASATVYCAGGFMNAATIYDNTTPTTASMTGNSTDFDCYLTAFTTTGLFKWPSAPAIPMGGYGSYENIYATNYTSGKLWLTGYFDNTTSIGGGLTSNGGADIFTLQTDNSGTILHANSTGGPNLDIPGSPGKDNYFGGLCLTGTFNTSSTIGSVSLAGTGYEPFFTTVNYNYPLAIANSGGSYIGSGPSLSATSPSLYTSYQWYRNGVIIPGANSATYVPTVKGKYSLVGYDGCLRKYTSNVIEITDDCNPSGYSAIFGYGPHTLSGYTAVSSQNIIIDDVLTVPSGATLDINSTSDVLMTACSKILVQNGGTLSISNSVLRGCSQWLGIEAESGATVTITGSTIKDAVVGVYAVNAALSVNTSSFYDNYLGIGIQSKQAATTCDIQSSIFTQMDYLTPSCTTAPQYGYNGQHNYINIDQSANVNIHNNNAFTGITLCIPGSVPPCTHADVIAIYLTNSDMVSITDQNSFNSDFDAAIRGYACTNTEITTANSFNNIDGNYGCIWFENFTTANINENSFANSVSGVTGLNSDVITCESNTMNTVTNGIYFKEVPSFHVHLNNFSKGDIGVQVYKNNYNPVTSVVPCLISENSFDAFTQGIVISPDRNPLNYTGGANTLIAGSSPQAVAMLCNTLNNVTYGISGSEELIDQTIAGDDPNNTFSGTRPWDIIWFNDPTAPAFTYYYNSTGTAPNTGLLMSTTNLNGVSVTDPSGTNSYLKYMTLTATSTTVSVCDYNPFASGSLIKSGTGSQLNKNRFRVYPNPTVNYVEILCTIPGSLHYELTDINGMLIEHGDINNGGQIHLEPYAKGMYFLKIKAANGESFIEKIVKQ